MKKHMKTFAALALAGGVGLSTVGCSMLGGEEAGPSQLSADGTYVLAPKDGGLFTMSVEGANVKIVKSQCLANQSGSAQDPRQTAFGELASLDAEAKDATATSLKWLERGAFAAGGEQESVTLELMSAGDMVRVDTANFFNADGAQGKALTEQFESSCAAAPAKTGDTADPTATATSPSTDPSSTLEPTAPAPIDDTGAADATPSPSTSESSVLELD